MDQAVDPESQKLLFSIRYIYIKKQKGVILTEKCKIQQFIIEAEVNIPLQAKGGMLWNRKSLLKVFFFLSILFMCKHMTPHLPSVRDRLMHNYISVQSKHGPKVKTQFKKFRASGEISEPRWEATSPEPCLLHWYVCNNAHATTCRVLRSYFNLGHWL